MQPCRLRLFGEGDVERIAFIKRAQFFGLRLDDIGALLDIRRRVFCSCGPARRIAAGRDVAPVLFMLKKRLPRTPARLATRLARELPPWAAELPEPFPTAYWLDVAT